MPARIRHSKAQCEPDRERRHEQLLGRGFAWPYSEPRIATLPRRAARLRESLIVNDWYAMMRLNSAVLSVSAFDRPCRYRCEHPRQYDIPIPIGRLHVLCP